MKIPLTFALLAVAAASQAGFVLTTDSSLFKNSPPTLFGDPQRFFGGRLINSAGGVQSLTQASADGSTGDWFGGFLPGDRVILSGGGNAGGQLGERWFLPSGYREIYSTNALQYQIQSKQLGGFWVETFLTYNILQSNGTFLERSQAYGLRVEGLSQFTADGSALKVGIVSDDPAYWITGFGIRVRSLNEATWGSAFGIGNVRYGDLQLQTVPEPASMVALGLGALALLRRKRRS